MRVRSGYSFKTSFGHLKQVKARLEEIGWPVQPISDRASTFAFNNWSKLVETPIYGAEVACTPNSVTDIPRTGHRDYWTFFAKNKIIDINRVVGNATNNANKSEPALLYREALISPDVIKIMGEGTQLEEIDFQTKELLITDKQIKNDPDLYIALSPAMPRALYRIAKKRKVRFIACSDNYYPNADDAISYRIALGRRSSTQSYPTHILSDDEWLEACSFADPKDLKAAIKNRNAAFKQCHAKLEKATLVTPERKASLRKMCEVGAKRLGVNLKNKEYAARLTRELKLIEEKKFEDYFYIIADIVDWSKDRMLVGPARGSSCGSLVCYLLGITTVDPIAFDLIFERFIDINRNDLPDIDIDFSESERHLAFDYVEQKYGSLRTARLGTVGKFRPRSALNAAGAALKIEPHRIEKVLESLLVRQAGDERALHTLEDTLTETDVGQEFAKDYPEAMKAAPLEGHPTNASQHAAGIIITEKEIENYVAVDRRTKAAMCDKRDAEDLGMLKIDMLGLTQLSVFERALELIGVASRHNLNYPLKMNDGRRFIDYFNDIPLDDQAAFDIVNRREFSGVFQFNGSALQGIASAVHCNHIEDFIAITALGRPGPMDAGGTEEWMNRRSGKSPVTYWHPVFEPYLNKTSGVIVYQEQVMHIVREVGDMSWDEVTQIRKAMSKSLGREYFAKYGERWKAGAIKKGVPVEVADDVWLKLCANGSYAFNRSHAAAYGIMSYWSAWLKAHYKVQFAAATLDAESDPMRQLLLLRELETEGIKYVPVDTQYSTDRWNINDQGVLVGPLTAIKGIGPAAVQEIIDHRKEGKALKPGTAKKLGGSRTPIDSLYPISDAIHRLAPDLTERNIHTTPTPIIQIKPNGFSNETHLAIGVVTRVAPKDKNEPRTVAQRGGKVWSGQSKELNIWLRDDSGEVLCKIGYRNFISLNGKEWAERIRAGKTILAVKGDLIKGIPILFVNAIRYIGEMDDETEKLEAAE
jgi:DNA polymerase III alpha subunit